MLNIAGCPCGSWVNKLCSGVKGKLPNTNAAFVCKLCRDGKTQGTSSKTHIDLGTGIPLNTENGFRYLGDMISGEGGADAAVVARIRSAWRKLRELSPLITKKGISLKLKVILYKACVRSCMLYGSETWPLKVERLLSCRGLQQA